MFRHIIFIITFVITSLHLCAQNFAIIDSSDTEQDIIYKAARVVPTAAQLRWQQLELTAFFHFGINTFTGKEWGTGKESAALFNPSQLDARQWVKVAKAAGIKQVILTAKHHDGFCLWPTATTSHSVKSSPWKNGRGDVVQEMVDACRKEKIGIGLYLSPWDMHAPMYGTDAYNDFFVAQLTELLSNYGRIDELWFDGANGEGPNGKKQQYDFDRWYKLIRKLQPQAVIAIMGSDVRWVGTETGYGREQEWSVVPTDNLNPAAIANHSQQEIAFKPQGDMMGNDLGSREKIVKAKGLVWYPAETDVSIRPGWFYHEQENEKVKSPQKLLDIYFNSVGRNGVLLLNIPPDKRGRIHDADIAALMQWKKMRDAIFKTNIARKATPGSGNTQKLSLLIDGRPDTYAIAQPTDSLSVIEFSFKQPKKINTGLFQEDIRKGQRIEKFLIEAFVNGRWQSISTGTTVGYKRLQQFETIQTQKIRFSILASRAIPYLAEIGWYYQPTGDSGNHKP